MSRRRDLQDYIIEIDERGKKVAKYIGITYNLTIDGGEYTKLRMLLFIKLAGVVAAYIVCGIIPTDVTRILYISLPYGVAFLTTFFGILDVFGILTKKTAFTRKEFNKMSINGPRQFSATMILILISATGAIVQGLVNRDLTACLLYFPMCLVLAALCEMTKRDINRISDKVK